MGRTPKQAAGDAAEELVAERLRVDGWELLGRQVRVGRAELDIVALDPGPPRRLVAVEVRWRSRREWGLPEETVTVRKLARLWAALTTYAGDELAPGGLGPGGGRLVAARCAVDVVAVEPGGDGQKGPKIRHHRDAFGRR